MRPARGFKDWVLVTYEVTCVATTLVDVRVVRVGTFLKVILICSVRV